MAAADGGATPPAVPADSAAPRAARPVSEASPNAAPPGSQIDALKNLTPDEKLNTLVYSWNTVATSTIEKGFLTNLYKKTLHFLLQSEWSQTEKSLRDNLIRSLEKCSEALHQENASRGQNVGYLVLVAKDPWHHPVLKEIMNGTQPKLEEVRSWIEVEGSYGAVERLKQLCAAGGKLESAALRLARALAPPPPSQVLIQIHHTFALEALLVLLFRARKTSECISQIKALEINEAIGIIRRLAKRNKSHGRIWKNAHDTALLSGQVLVATCLVKTIEDNQLYNLALLLASLYSNCPDELAPTFRKLLQSADTATHIYTVCKAVQNQYFTTMKPFICELYIRALTTGVNELERLKLQDEGSATMANASHKLAHWFISLADLLSPNPTVSAECILTAFSLHPSKFYYEQVEKCSLNFKNQKPTKSSCDYNVSISQNNSYHNNSTNTIDDLKNDVSKLNILNNNKEIQRGESVKSSVSTEVCADSSRDVAQSLISAAVLEGEGLEISTDLCRDLVVLLSGPRLKSLTWDLSWDKLSHHCLSYMADTEEGTKTVMKELKYVHLDYSQYEIKEPEIHDMYFGIEKGYEHHLEIDDSEDETIDNAASDSLTYDETLFNSNYDKDVKYVKKKSSKNRPDKQKLMDSEQFKDDCNKSKLIAFKSDKIVTNASKNKNNPVSQLNESFGIHGAINENFKLSSSSDIPDMFRKTLSVDMGVSSNMKFNDLNKHTLYQSPQTSFYRKQMELHEANKKEIEKELFGGNPTLYKGDKVYHNETNLVSRVNPKMCSSLSNNLTYHEGSKENLKNRRDIAECDKGISKHPQNVSQVPHKSNSCMYDQAKKSNQQSYSRQSAIHSTPNLYQHPQHSAITDWELLINDNVNPCFPSKESFTKYDHQNMSPYNHKPENLRYSNDYIKSLNMQHTKLPSDLNMKVSPPTPKSTSKPTKHNCEMLLQLLKEPSKPRCYVPQQKLSRNDNLKIQLNSHISNTPKNVVSSIPTEKNLPKPITEKKPPGQSVPYKTDSFDSFNVITKMHDTFNQISSQNQNIKKACPSSSTCVRPEKYPSLNEGVLNPAVESSKITSVNVQSKDDDTNSISKLESSILEDFNSLLCDNYFNDSEFKMIFPNSSFSSEPQSCQQYPQDTIQSINQDTIIRNKFPLGNDHEAKVSRSCYSSFNQQKSLPHNSVQIKDTHINNTGINNQDNNNMQQFDPKIKYDSTSRNPTQDTCTEVQRNVTFKNEILPNPPVKYVPDLMCSDAQFDLKIQENVLPKNLTNVKHANVGAQTNTSNNCAIKTQLEKFNVNLNDISVIKTTKTIQKERKPISHYDVKIVRKEKPTCIPLVNNNKSMRILNEISPKSDGEGSGGNKNVSQIINTNICAKPAKKLQKPIYSPTIDDTKQLLNECLVENSKTIEMKDEYCFSEEDAFLKELYKSVNAGLQNPNEKSTYKSLSDQESVNDGSIYEEFLAELHSSVNAGTTQPFSNSQNNFENQIIEDFKNYHADRSFTTNNELQPKKVIKPPACLSSLKYTESVKDVTHMMGPKHNEMKNSLINTSDQKTSIDIPVANSSDLIMCDKKSVKKDIRSNNRMIKSSQSSDAVKNLHINCINDVKSENLLNKSNEFITGTSTSPKFEKNQPDLCFKNSRLTEMKKPTENPVTPSKTITENVYASKTSTDLNDLLTKISSRIDIVVKVAENSVSKPDPSSKIISEKSNTCIPQTIVQSKECVDKFSNTIKNSNSTENNSDIGNSKVLTTSCSRSIPDPHFESPDVQNSDKSQQPLCMLVESNNYPTSSAINLLDQIPSTDIFPLQESEKVVDRSMENLLADDKNQNSPKAANTSNSDTENGFSENLVSDINCEMKQIENSEEGLNLLNTAVEFRENTQIVHIEPLCEVLDDNSVKEKSVLSFRFSGNSSENVLRELKLVPAQEPLKKSSDVCDDSDQIDFENAIALNIITPKEKSLDTIFSKNKNSNKKQTKIIKNKKAHNKEKNKNIINNEIEKVIESTENNKADSVGSVDLVLANTTENLCSDINETLPLIQQDNIIKDSVDQIVSQSNHQTSEIECSESITVSSTSNIISQNPDSDNNEDKLDTEKCGNETKTPPISTEISLDEKCEVKNNSISNFDNSDIVIIESSKKQESMIPTSSKVINTEDIILISDETNQSENTITTNINSQINVKNVSSLTKKLPVKLIPKVLYGKRPIETKIVRKIVAANQSDQNRSEKDSSVQKEIKITNKVDDETNKKTNQVKDNAQLKKVVNRVIKKSNSKNKSVTTVKRKKQGAKYVCNNDEVIDITLDDSDEFKTPVKNDVIEISSDEESEMNSSDIEIICTNDPIAIDIISPLPEPKSNADKNILSTDVPTFFTHVPNILKKSIKRKSVKKSNSLAIRNQRQSPRGISSPKSINIVENDLTEILKIAKIPQTDLVKLLLPCAVKISRLNAAIYEKFSKLKNGKPKKKKYVRRIVAGKTNLNSTNDSKKTNLGKKYKKTVHHRVKTIVTRNSLKMHIGNFESNVSKQNIRETDNSNAILHEEIKEDTDDSGDSENTLINIKLNIVKLEDESLNIRHDPNDKGTNNSANKSDNQHTNEKQNSNTLKDKENNCPDVLDNLNIASFDARHEKTKDSLKNKISPDNESFSKDALQPDILYQSNSILSQNHISKTLRRYSNENACVPTVRLNKIKRTSPIDVVQCSNICPDLLSKNDDKNTLVTMQPDIVLSNDRKKISLADPPLNNDNSESDDEKIYVSFKTYQKTHYHKNKRKSDVSTTNSVKRIRTSSKIDLPEISQEDINLITHDDFSLEVERLLMEGSESLELFWKDDPIKENLDIDTSRFDLEYKFDFLSKNSNLKIDDCSRNSFYSPIFNECETDSAIESYIEKFESHETIERSEENKTIKHSRQGKGFGVRSDRGNLKDSIRGRPEGPAAVLSDTFTTRPPLALHNFSVKNKNKDCISLHTEEILQKGNVNDDKFVNLSLGHAEKEMNNNSLCRTAKISKSILRQFFNRINENGEFNDSHISKEKLYDSKHQRETNMRSKNSCFSYKNGKHHKINRSDNIFSRVPGLEDLDFMRPLPSTAIVQVVQLGQSPVTSAQQNQLTALPTVSQTNTNEYADVSTNNSREYQALSNEDSRQSNSNEINNSDTKENDNSEGKPEVNDSSNKKSDENTSLSISCEISDAETNQLQISPTSDPPNTSSDIGNLDQIAIDKSNSLNFNEQVPSQSNYTDNIQAEEKDTTMSEPLIENQISNVPSSSANFISTNRGQTLVNLLSQKIIHSPVAGQHVQMTTFPKGTINALSLQQALAQILPPPLSQASNESVIQSSNHSSGPQVVHIVQGKSGSQNNNSFSSLLVDNAQTSVMNNPGSAQVLHIVQGKPTPNTSNSSILGQSQISGTTFSGLSLVDSNSQQSGNQVLHIVNAGMQSKNNTAQVLKRVNLLTSITNPQGNNEQKMVQFVCKSSDGKPIQLNAQHQRGMVLRLQPIDNSTFATPKSENQTMNTNISSVQSTIKPQNDQAQELKSRSVYEENYAKFIQNSNQIPSSPEKSTTLPKFNQAFGKSVFQDNAVSKPSDNIDQSQNIAVSVSNEQNTQDISNTLNLSQLGHMNNPPLLIRKNPSSNIVHQNVVQQVKQSIAPMNIQTIHGGVIYTRQIPVNTINLITVPSSDMIDEVQLQSIQKQNQEKSTVGETHMESQVVKIVSQEQPQSNNTICQMESSTEESNSTFTEQSQNNVNTHPLLTQMRIKMPMLSKGNSQMVTGARVVRPVLQIQRNLIPGTNPAVYQQLVLTTAPTLRQPVPTTPTTNVRPSRPSTTTPQESNMSTSTLEQLREFDMVLEQVKERSTVQPGSNSNSTFSDTSPRHVIDNNTELDSSQSNVVHSPAQREVLYSIGPNQTVNVTYVNQKVISKTPTVLTTTYTSSDSNISSISSQNSPSNQITHGLVNTISHTKPCTNTPTKVNSKSIKTKPTKPTNPSSSSTSKPNPVAAKTSLQKPLEDEQTTQRILYILAEYKEQVENSPDKDKPAPRRRSNPPTNPTTSSKRKKGSSGNSKKSSSGQNMQEMSPLGGEDAGHTMGSEDSSCGLSQGECTDNSIQGTDNQSPQASPQKAAKKLLFQSDSDMSQSTTQLQPQQQSQPQQQRNVIIADGQTIAMTRPGTGKTTAVLMPANYLLPMSMVKGGQQITIVTNQGPKILSVPQGEGNATNTLFLQRLISPTGLKPMLTRPGQVRHVRLPANTVQNLQAFNLSPNTNVNSQETSWISNNSLNTNQPKLVVEYNPNLTNNSDLNPDSVKSEISDSPSLKEENVSLNNESLTCIKHEDTGENNENRLDENISIDQSQTSLQDSNIPNLSDHVLQQVHVTKSSTNTLNLIQVHSLNSPECGKLFTVQNSSGLNSLIQIPNKSLNQTLHNLNSENEGISTIVSESSQNILRKQSLDNQFLTKTEDGDSDIKLPDINQLDENLSISDDLSNNGQQSFVLHSNQQSNDPLNKCHGNRETHTPWSTNGSVNREASPNFGYESSPHRLSNRDEHHDPELPENEEVQDMAENVTTRVLRHSYSPSSSPTGPRHLYHKMFISAPAKKSFGSEITERSASSVDEDKQYVQVLDIRHPDRKATESVDVTTTVQGTRNSISSSSTSAHNAASLRHKYAVMEHELRLQKSLSEECEDLGVDSPSASDLFPEAELLFAASPSSQFDQSQDGCILPTNNQSSPTVAHINPSALNHQIASSSSISNLTRESRILSDQPMDVAEESEFARMHPNTTFHSGEIELVSDDADDASVNISFRRSSNKKSIPQSQVSSKRGDIVRSVIEGIGSSGGITTFSQSKMSSQFSMVDLSRRSRNTLSSLQSSDDYSEGADDSMNSAESKEGLINNKSLDGILTNEIVKRDINLSSTESSVCMSSSIIQRNVTQVIRHSSSDQLSLPGNDSSDKLCSSNITELAPNGRNFLLEGSNDARTTTDAGILKSIMLERDGRDALTCSSPEQHSELFWESNSNSNQSEEHLPQAPTNLLDFSSEDSNKCCKSPLSCEETNSTDSSSMGGHNPQSHNSHHPLRLNSVIKTSVGNSSAADGPILHNALISNTPNVMTQDISKKMPISLNSIHKSDSNMSSSPEEDVNRTSSLRTWGRSIKTSGSRKVISPRSLSAEINMGAEIETSSSEGVSILTKSTSGTLMHSGSSTPEEGSSNNRRVSLRGSGGIKRSCHCCGGAPATSASTNNTSTSRRARRRPPPLH